MGKTDLANLDIMLFDTDTGSARVTKQAFQQAGCRCPHLKLEAGEIRAGLERHNSDIVAVDLVSDASPGVELIRALRDPENDASKKVRIVSFIAEPTREALNRAIYAGADGALVKPLVPTKIAHLLQQLMSLGQDYVESPGYAGPDRRRLPDEKPYEGEERRES